MKHHQENPDYLRYAYLSFVLTQVLQFFLLITLAQPVFPDRSILTGPTQFWIRAHTTSTLPFALLVFLLRDQPVSTPVGKKVALAFTLLHAFALLLVIWYRAYETWWMEPFWVSVVTHSLWFASGAAALKTH